MNESDTTEPDKEKLSATEANEKKNERISEILLAMVELKLDEDADYFDKLGVIEVLTELVPHNKFCYQSLTTKEAFEIITRLLVSENSDCERFTYQLLNLLIQNYEKYERF